MRPSSQRYLLLQTLSSMYLKFLILCLPHATLRRRPSKDHHNLISKCLPKANITGYIHSHHRRLYIVITTTAFHPPPLPPNSFHTGWKEWIKFVNFSPWHRPNGLLLISSTRHQNHCLAKNFSPKLATTTTTTHSVNAIYHKSWSGFPLFIEK